MLSLLLIGIFYIFTFYASAIGWGTGSMAAFASNANPYFALGHSLWGVGWWFVFIAIVNSSVGVGLACTNAASRVAYTMGQAGTPARPVRPDTSGAPHADVRDRRSDSISFPVLPEALPPRPRQAERPAR
jgi:hypothetical protein